MRQSVDNSLRACQVLMFSVILSLSACGTPGNSGTTAPIKPTTPTDTSSEATSSFNRLLHQNSSKNKGNSESSSTILESGKTRQVAREFVLGLLHLGKATGGSNSWWRNRTLRMPFPENDFDVELLRELQRARFKILESNQEDKTAQTIVYTVTLLSSGTGLTDRQREVLGEQAAARLALSRQQPSQYRFELVIENEYVLSRDYLTDEERVYPLGPMTLKDLLTGAVQALSIDDQSIDDLAVNKLN